MTTHAATPPLFATPRCSESLRGMQGVYLRHQGQNPRSRQSIICRSLSTDNESELASPRSVGDYDDDGR
eukprot:5163322-Alexandrium_andersonii.AAC.1